MADFLVSLYWASVATLLVHGWRERRSEFIRHASLFEWFVVLLITFCPVINTIAAGNVWWKWFERK